MRNEYSDRKHEAEGYPTTSLRDRVQEHEVPHHGQADRPEHPELHPGKHFVISLCYGSAIFIYLIV